MQNLITSDLLSHYTELVNTALSNPQELPAKICEYLVTQMEYQAAVFFSLDEQANFVVRAKAGTAKDNFTQNAAFQCNACRSVHNNDLPVIFSNVAECEIQASENVVYEGCLFLNMKEKGNVLIKTAKQTPFSRTDKETIESLGRAFRELIILWKDRSASSAQSLSQIVTDIAHELRTPTNSILGFASLLNEDNLSASQAEYVSTLKENAFNLLTLINDLIDLARVEQKLVKKNLSSVSISDFLDEIIKLFSQKIDSGKIEFMVKVDNNVPAKVKIDTQKIRYILVNIITQSLRMTENGKITVSAAKTDNKLSIRVSDTSPGIPSDKLKNLFKPFTAESLESSRFGNVSGLGLSITKKYAEILGGQISAASSVGKGTNYNLEIPIDMEHSVQSPSIEQKLSSLPKPGKNNRVLVVEDDYATSKLLSNYLAKWGYKPVIVNSSEQTLKIVEKENFLAILMDIELPDSNGFELLKTLREHKATKNTPVIVCSVEPEQQKAFLMGAVEYFVKPINYKFLVEVLQSYKLKRDSNILIVDDDVPTLNLLKEAVEQLGFNAIAEAHSSRVPEMINNLDLDLAIIDLEMPEVNGYELIKLIKSRPKFNRLPILIYTGKENYQDELKKIDGMFEELLHKSSVNIEELSGTISSMIDRYEEPAKPEEIMDEKDTVKILLVEDYKHSQIIVTRLLKKNSFESIVVVENGAEALEQVKKQKFHLILMDMQMPVMNGFEATEKIRQLPEYKDTPIIALTAFAMKGDREKCLEAGATDYIPKPIDSQEFIEKVKHYTEAKVQVQ